MKLERQSPCKVNLVLNILGKRPDGFHELETLMHPIAVCDVISVEQTSAPGVELTCSNPALPTDSGNLVHRAASAFLEATKLNSGIRIHLGKQIPLAAGLGGGSGNAATTLSALNELFGTPFPADTLQTLAAGLGSDVPFFLQHQPAVATGRGEKVVSLKPFECLVGKAFVLVHPGFGVSTPWAYQNLARFPAHLNGRAGRALEVAEQLANGDLRKAAAGFYNSLEAPVLEKYPLLTLYQQFFRENGALSTLMSGSGSTTFALFEDLKSGQTAVHAFREKFGPTAWTACVPA